MIAMIAAGWNSKRSFARCLLVSDGIGSSQDHRFADVLLADSDLNGKTCDMRASMASSMVFQNLRNMLNIAFGQSRWFRTGCKGYDANKSKGCHSVANPRNHCVYFMVR